MKTSIIILTYNQLQYTKLCIDSIRLYTENYELIVVDNASTDGTVEWLKMQEDIKLIENEQNKGFPKGCNQGIEIATGDNILLLNNDTIVTKNWLDNLLKCLYSSNDIGAVGPVTNNCSYYQAVHTDYKTIEEMHTFARQYNTSDHEQWEGRLKLIGFCMLIKAEVVKKVGLLDERFTPGNFEDDDYSFRMRQAGYKLVLCKDTFIHHFGSASFKEKPASYTNLLRENAQKFAEKWGFNSAYSSFIRNEVISLIDAPKNKEINVLEIGCACGGTLLKIKNLYKNANLYGIELNENSAAIASQFANIKAENIENEQMDYPDKHFDYIILADVLEHLYNPWKVVKNLKRYLKEDGKILASIPNVMHYSLLKQAINGNWTYTDVGLLDRTHVRFFTLNEINKMFSEAGYAHMHYEMTTIQETKEDEEFIHNLMQLSKVSDGNHYRAYQYLVKVFNSNAEQQLKKIIETIEGYLGDHVGIELIELAEHKVEDMIAAVCEYANDRIQVLNFLAIKSVEEGMIEESLLYLEKAFELNHEDMDTLYNLVAILHGLGKLRLARKYFHLIKNKDDETFELFKQIYNEGDAHSLLSNVAVGDNPEDSINKIINLLRENLYDVKDIINVIEYLGSDKIYTLRLIGQYCCEQGLYGESVTLLQRYFQHGEADEDALRYLETALEKWNFQKQFHLEEVQMNNQGSVSENTICFIICVNNEELYKDCLKHLNELKVPAGFHIEVKKITNATSMTSAYNNAMRSSNAKYKVYLHQDTLIINKNFIIDIIELFKQHQQLGLLGVIGCESIPSNGVWWESNTKTGKVIEYRNTFNVLDFTESEKSLSYVQAVDGLLMVTQYDVPWREDIMTGWHLYDTSQSLEFIKHGYSVGIPSQKNPWVVHFCGTDFDRDLYLHYLKIFVNEYSHMIEEFKESLNNQMSPIKIEL